MSDLIQRVLEYNKKQAQKDEIIAELKEALNIMGVNLETGESNG